MKVPVVLSVAGSDSSAGAGLQADIRTCASLGVYCATAVAAVTAQNTSGVTHLHVVPGGALRAQLEAVFSDLNVVVVKTGMLGSVENIKVLSEVLTERTYPKLIVDPVFRPTTGEDLFEKGAVSALKDLLLPRASVLTPNTEEAAVLLGKSVEEVLKSLENASRGLIALGLEAAVITGGDRGGDAAEDVLCIGDDSFTLRSKRIKTNNNHGTGCTFSSALAAYLVRGEKMKEAVIKAKLYTEDSLERAEKFKLGSGKGPVLQYVPSEWRE